MGLMDKITNQFMMKRCIRSVCAGIGCTTKEAEERLRAGREKGILPEEYVRYQCWNKNESELTACGKKCRQIRGIRKETGWSWEIAEEKLDKAKQLGIPNFKYISYECWKKNEEELERLGIKCGYIKRVRKETDWKWNEAELRMNQAEALGLSNEQYVKNKAWKLEEDEIETLGRSLKAVQAQEESAGKYIQRTKEDLTDAQRSCVEEAVRLGIPERECIRKSLWLLEQEELAEYAEVVKKRREKKQEDHDFYVSIICEKAGWDRPKAEAALKCAVERGIPEIRYVQKEAWNRTESEMDFLVRYMKEDKKRVRGNKQKYAEMVCEATGWNIAKAELEIAKAKLNCGASYEDYFAMKMFEMSPAEQREYATYGLFSKIRMKYNNFAPGRKYFDNKAIFNQTFADCIHRKWFVNRELSYEEFLEHIDGLDAVLVKLLSATQGIGARKFSCRVDDKRALYDEIMALPASIVEEYIVQHPAMMAFCDTSVNTLRIATLNAHGKCNFIYGLFRTGQGDVVDNMHAGGIASAVDPKTGIAITHPVDLDGNIYPVNPYSGLAMKGFQIPHWDKIIECCNKIYDRVPGVALVGWDFAITPDGVDLIEGNPGASYIGVQIPCAQDKIGLRREMVDPYL